MKSTDKQREKARGLAERAPRERTILYFQGPRCEADRLNIAGLSDSARAHGW